MTLRMNESAIFAKSLAALGPVILLGRHAAGFTFSLQWNSAR